MADDTQAGTQAEPSQQPQAGTTTNPAPQAGAEPTTASHVETLSLEEAKKLRQEHNALRKRVAEYEAQAKAAEDAKLSEQEKLTKALAEKQAREAELTLEVQRMRLERAVDRQAAALNIADSDAALILLQAEHGHEVDYDDDGKPTNVEKLLKAVLDRHPALAAQPQTQQRPTQPPASSGGAASPSRSQTAAQPQPRDLKTQPIRRLSDIWPGR